MEQRGEERSLHGSLHVPRAFAEKPGSETATSRMSRERTTASSCNLSLEELHDAR